MVTPAGSCQEATAPTPFADATHVSNNVRPTLNTKANTKPAKMQSARRLALSAYSSPKNRASISVAWRERMPLHASSMPTLPVATSMTLPCWMAGTPMTPSNSTVTPVFARISP